jgi:DNA-binding HxlR family transcriptional regulator
MKRAGGQALSLLAAPLNFEILRALEEGPKELIDLRRAVGFPPQSTMRVYSRALSEVGVLERRRQNEFPGSSLYVLTPAGQGLLRVGEVLQAWLNQAPDGPIALGSTAAKNTIGALVEGWSTSIVRAVAAKPLSLTELNRLIPRVSYPSLERRLGGLRLAKLVEAHPSGGRGTPYGATRWLQRAVVPLVSAVGWERSRHPEASPPLRRTDVEAIFLLAIPLAVLPDTMTGKCRLTVEMQDGSSVVYAGVLVCIEKGKIVSCSTRLRGEVESWASGTPSAWLRRMNGGSNDALEIGGETEFALSLVDGLRLTAAGGI